MSVSRETVASEGLAGQLVVNVKHPLRGWGEGREGGREEGRGEREEGGGRRGKGKEEGRETEGRRGGGEMEKLLSCVSFSGRGRHEWVWPTGVGVAYLEVLYR